jgi:hypothetical protein
VKPGDNVTFVGLDLFCRVFPTGADPTAARPELYCSRKSGNGHSRAIVATRFHYYVTDESGVPSVYQASRTP